MRHRAKTESKMALIAYSDSENSDVDDAPKARLPLHSPSTIADKPAVQKTEPRKIRVDLPSLQADAATHDEQPPAKRARTQGAFGGFNSLLPAPKRAAQSGPKAGVSLKTSSEAAFSRETPSTLVPESQDPAASERDNVDETGEKPAAAAVEVALVGSATRFKPLSVGNKKQKKRILKSAPQTKPVAPASKAQLGSADVSHAIPVKQGKRSLFSVAEDTEEPVLPAASEKYEYEAIVIHDNPSESPDVPTALVTPIPLPSANSLDAVASDLNLTPAQRRHLFGRYSKSSSTDINVASFNLDSEYAHNEKLRQNGEAFEHRAVKSIAPGKHSLQQLVNNARSNQDSIEDKWAADRAKRGAGVGNR
nr:hypothetical protein CFP56_07575 [Quercus suber]